MWSYPIIVGLALRQQAAHLILSLAYAPVPREEYREGNGLLWTIAGVLVGVLVGIIVFRLIGKSAGKRGR
jgi:hypothetical protein